MNTLCLENYGVSKMETQEMKAVDGGIAPILAFALIVGACAVAYNIYVDAKKK